MRQVLAGAALMLALVSLAAVCGSPHSAPHPVPTKPRTLSSPGGVSSPGALSPPGAVVPVATHAPVLRPAGRAVYLRGDELYVGALDGTTERQLTHGSAPCEKSESACATGTGYAGSAEIDGRTWLYIAQAVARIQTDFALPVYRYSLLRTPLDGGATEELFRFDGFTHGPSVASVSPDGQHVAYTSTDGLHRFDVAGRQDVLLFASVTLCSHRSGDLGPCSIFENPLWSPRGDLLYVEIGYMEGARPAIFDPQTPPRAATPLAVGGRFAAWAPDGSKLCISQDGYAQGEGGVLTVADQAFQPLVDSAQSCAWAADGQLAFTRWAGSGDTPGTSLSTFGASSHPDIDLRRTSASLIAAWLPDESGVILWGSTGQQRFGTSVAMLDGEARSLPFGADRVLGVLP